MRIPALALAERALVLDGRSHAASQLRSLLVVLAMVALCIAIASGSWFGAPGLTFYWSLGNANFWFIAAYGISVFTTVVTEEKENGTLGLLKLAGFGSLSILIGKSIGQLLTMLLLLLVQVPFALLAFTLGGVTRHQILAGWLLLLAHLLFVYALGLLASVLAPRSSTAARIAGVTLLGYLAVPWIAVWGRGLSGGAGGLLGWLFQTSALQGFHMTALDGYDEPLVGAPMLVTLAMAAVMFVLAAVLFAPLTHREVEAAPERLRRRRGNSRPGNWPLFWKDFTFGTGGARGLGLRCLAYGAAVLAVNLNIDAASFGMRGFFTVAILVLVGGLDLGNHCSRMFREEDNERTLPLLAILPVPLVRWAYAKAAACACLALPALACFALWALLLPEDCGQLFAIYLSAGGACYLLALTGLGLHLATWLSLVMPRGALAVAFLVTQFASSAITPMLFWANAGQGARVVLALILTALALAMHPAIFWLLRRRAAE